MSWARGAALKTGLAIMALASLALLEVVVAP